MVQLCYAKPLLKTNNHLTTLQAQLGYIKKWLSKCTRIHSKPNLIHCFQYQHILRYFLTQILRRNNFYSEYDQKRIVFFSPKTLNHKLIIWYFQYISTRISSQKSLITTRSFIFSSKISQVNLLILKISLNLFYMNINHHLQYNILLNTVTNKTEC